MNTTVSITYDCCNRTVELPTAIPGDGSALHHYAALDTAILFADAIHDAQCDGATS